MQNIKKFQPPKKEMVATSLRVEKGVLIAIDSYAREIDRSRNWVVNKLLKQSLQTLHKEIAEFK